MDHLQMIYQLMELKIDSGADITVISGTDYLETQDRILDVSSTILR